MQKRHKSLIIRFVASFILLGSLAALAILFKDRPATIEEPIVDSTMSELKEVSDDLDNISELPEEFMENYLESFAEIGQTAEVENTLIVTSTEKIENTFGAAEMIEAPNNQYFLYYNSLAEKESAMDALEKETGVLYVEEDSIRELTEYNSWGVEAMGLDQAINNYDIENSEEVTVAIIDTGCEMRLFNENFPGRIEEVYNLYDQYGIEDMEDHNVGHGTHIAGTIAESTPSNVKIIPIKITDTSSLRTSTIVTAINYVNYYHKADVINMSFSSNSFSNSEYVALQSAAKNKIIGVAAVGNEATSAKRYPAAYDNTIAVAALDTDGGRASFSNYGSYLTFTAPGADIKSINGTKSGTSMATPHVASAVAILKGTNKDLNLEQTIAILKNVAIDIGTPGKDIYTGYGMIDMSQYATLKTMTENTAILDFEITDASLVVPNFGNITNLMNIKVRLMDAAGNFYDKTLGDLEGLEIVGYDAFSAGAQEIQIKYNGMSKNITVDNGEQGGNTAAYNVVALNEQEAVIENMTQDVPKRIYIPEVIDGHTIVALGKDTMDYDFMTTSGLVEYVILPDSVREIKKKVFYEEPELKSVTGGTEYMIVGEQAFVNAYKMTEFEPKVASLGIASFYGAASLKEVVLSDDITLIPEAAFRKCSRLEHVNMPNSLTQIDEFAFAETSLQSINIPKGLVSMGRYVFLDAIGLETITVDPENTVYDSRDNSNALIETVNNKIITGSSNTVIPDSVTAIEQGAFYGNTKLEKIYTNNVTVIGGAAFDGCINLREIHLEREELFGNDSLKRLTYVSNEKYDKLPNVVVYAETDSGSEVTQQTVKYLDDQAVRAFIKTTPADIEIEVARNYTAFQKVGDIKITALHEGFAEPPYDLENLVEDYTIEYQHGDSFRAGDTSFTVRGTTVYGKDFETEVAVTVTKIAPTYSIPNNLTAKMGQKLSEVALPSGFAWMNPDEKIMNGGNVTFKARYTPSDTVNYETVENIDIAIAVDVINFAEKLNAEGDQIILDWGGRFSTITDRIKDSVESSAISHLNKDNNNVVSDTVKTGDKIRIAIGNHVEKYDIVVRGDVDGNGAIGIIDYIRIKKDIMDIEKLVGIYYKAADVNNNNKIDIIDYIRIRKIIMEAN